MTHDNAFLQAIIENPDDDTPRLVYADWLEEHGQHDRAAFIRLQCQLALLPEDDPRQPELEARERELLQEHEREWLGPLRALGSWEFRRGFAEVITTRPETFLDHADALFRAAPVRRARFETGVFQLDRPHLANRSSGPLMSRLAACPHLTRLSALSLRHNLIYDSGVQALAASPHLGRLDSLDLHLNGVRDAGLEALAALPTWSRLTSLTLTSNHIGPAGGRALARSSHITRLASLDLGENPVGDEGVVALAGSPNLCHLETLGLARTGLGTAGARALATSPYLARLKSLDVRDNSIGNKARQALRLRFGKGKCRF